MPAIEQLVLAAITGLLFGYIVTLVGSSWQRLAAILLALWVLQSLSQLVLRALDGRDVGNELLVVGSLHLVFGVSAVGFVALRGWRSYGV